MPFVKLNGKSEFDGIIEVTINIVLVKHFYWKSKFIQSEIILYLRKVSTEKHLP